MAVEVQFYRSIWRGKSSQIGITAFFAICKASIVPVIMECMKRLSTFFTLTQNFYIGSPLHFLFCRQRRIHHPASRHISATAVLQPEPQPQDCKEGRCHHKGCRKKSHPLTKRVQLHPAKQRNQSTDSRAYTRYSAQHEQQPSEDSPKTASTFFHFSHVFLLYNNYFHYYLS